MKKIPAIIITGFLGSGKTTLVRHLLMTSLKGKKVALIENELGEVSVDSVILKTQNATISELTAGCICCTVSGEFEAAVTEILAAVAPDVLLIETTGIANPISVFMMLARDARLILDTIITVADAERLAENLAETLVAEIQLTISDLVVLNKTDIASAASVIEGERLIRTMNDRAPILKTVQGGLPAGMILISSGDTLREDLTEHVATLKAKYDEEIVHRLALKHEADHGELRHGENQGELHHAHQHAHGEQAHEVISGGAHFHLEVDEIETFAFEETGLFSHRKFEDLLSSMPRGYYRVKGVVYVSEAAMPVIFNFTSGRYTFDFDTLAGDAAYGAEAKSIFVFIGKRVLRVRDEMHARLLQCKAGAGEEAGSSRM
ncbi:MAG: GTP-binding protein [Rhizobacter sp.]|nr:GTP-binding protein [Chlorobiales bacterium]